MLGDDPMEFEGPASGHAWPAMHSLLVVIAVLVLIAAGIAIGWAFARYHQYNRRREIARTIRLALLYETQKALVSFGPAKIQVASDLAAYVRKAIGPVLVLADGLSGPLKSIANAEKGKIKGDAKSGGASASSGPGSAAVAIVVGGAAPPPAAAPERDMTTQEREDEARKGIEGLAAYWRQPNFEDLLVNAASILDAPRVQPPPIFQQAVRKSGEG
jgi:hypothetical protein